MSTSRAGDFHLLLAHPSAAPRTVFGMQQVDNKCTDKREGGWALINIQDFATFFYQHGVCFVFFSLPPSLPLSFPTFLHSVLHSLEARDKYSGLDGIERPEV